MSVTVVATPRLKSFTHRTASYLKEKQHYDGLFLPFPKNFEEYSVQFGEGLPYDYVINQAKKSGLMPKPEKAWEESAKPILKILPTLKKLNFHLQIYCYGDPFYDKNSIEISMKIAILSLNSAITEKVKTAEWRRLLQREQLHRKEALRREVDFIIVKAGQHEKNVCVSTSNSEYVFSELQKEGYRVELKCIGTFFPPTPLDLLRKEAENKELSDEEIKELVLLQVQYLRECVLTSQNLDEAYQKWRKKKKIKQKG
jgi:hypothetical protein